MKPRAQADNAVDEARLRHGLAVAAYIVVRHGDAYAPILDRLQAELDAMQRRQSPAERARRVLASLDAYPAAAIGNAMR